MNAGETQVPSRESERNEHLAAIRAQVWNNQGQNNQQLPGSPNTRNVQTAKFFRITTKSSTCHNQHASTRRGKLTMHPPARPPRLAGLASCEAEIRPVAAPGLCLDEARRFKPARE